MNASKRLLAVIAAACALLAIAAGSAAAYQPPHHYQPPGYGYAAPLFVQTDNLAGNQVAVYDRAPNGTLRPAGLYATGGLGGQLEGSQVDHLASQGSLALDRQDGLLLAVNAGSDTISSFASFGDRLALRQTISSGGAFPVSVAVQGNLVYVLNAEQGGSVQGFRVIAGRLWPIPGSSRSLGLSATATPQFVNTPGQVAFSPDGSRLIVTTKANGEDVDVFAVDRLGLLSPEPVVNALPGTVPFAIAFDRFGRLAIAEAGTNALADFQLQGNGRLTPVDAVGTGQAATCWVVAVDGRFYASNAGSASISGFQEGPFGSLSLLGATPTDGGTVDATASQDGRYLYVQAGASGVVDEFALQPSGALSAIGSVSVPGAQGGEGIVAG